MTDTPAAYLRTSLEDFNRAHGLADQSQSISNQRKVILELFSIIQSFLKFKSESSSTMG